MWYGVVWYYVVWYSVVWCSVVWYSVVWYSVVWYSVVWYSVVWWCGVEWCGVEWCGVEWCGVEWCGVELNIFPLTKNVYFDKKRKSTLVGHRMWIAFFKGHPVEDIQLQMETMTSSLIIKTTLMKLVVWCCVNLQIVL